MKLPRTQLLIAVALSLAVHVAGAAIFTDPKETIKIAGGAATSELLIGNAFANSLMAGEIGEVLNPVETPFVEAELAEPTNKDADEQITETVVQPVSSESLQPDKNTPELSSLIEAAPATSELLGPALPANEIAPVAEPEAEIAIPENVPVPMVRPQPSETRTAKSNAPAPDRKKAAQAKPQKSKSADRKKQLASSKPKSTGDRGKEHRTTSRASNGTASAKRTTTGNAAVSNYPGKVASKIRRALRYPREARRQRIRGDVVVSFVVTKNGGVSSIRIARSSGFPVLDEAAKDAVRRAAPFPSIPTNAGRTTWPFSVPLGFTR